jgi:type VI secretion system secreted protein VgrG
MQNQVIADIEIEDQKIDYYTSVVIRQQFNAHHEFEIRIKYDVLEAIGSFSLSNSQKLIGKSTIIKLKQANSLDVAYEFRGIICEINMEQSDNFTSDLVLKGYSPTILLENGAHLASFYKKNLQQIVQTITKPVGDYNCKINIKPQHKSSITYICQYRESTFHFLNRLSSDFGECFYYDGKDLNFGKPSSSPNVEVTYGQDVHNLQFKLRILPLTFSGYSYYSKSDTLISSKSPSGVDGLDEYAGFALKESNKIFANPVNFPLKQRVESKGDLDGFLKKKKSAMAADLEVLTGTSDNPSLCIGAVASVKLSMLDASSAFKKDDCGNFLITGIEHHITSNDKYYNRFEGIPSGLEAIPVKNVIIPIAEPQVAVVTDNADPDNLGRVRVQMLWQQESGENTDWLRVMTPDAGTSDERSKNRGFVFVPEKGDQVLVCFRYNDADRPFVLGSIFQGKTAGGGEANNDKKTLSTRSGHVIELNDKEGAESITITDKKKNKIVIDTKGESISITANESINMDAPTITMTATSINMLAKGAITMNAGAAIEGAAGTMVTFGAGVSTSLISGRDTVILAGKMLSASGGKNAKFASGAGANLELQAKGEAKFTSSKKMDISSKQSTMSGTDKATFKSKTTVVEGSTKAVVKGSKVDIS